MKASDLRPFHPDDPLLKLAGVGESGRSDVSANVDRYVHELLRAKKTSRARPRPGGHKPPTGS
jgi:hypothetical protein